MAPTPMRPSLLVVNPGAGHIGGTASRRAQQLARILGERGFDCQIHLTEGPGHATVLARSAVQDAGVDAVFAAGGDGTVREVAAGLLGSRLALGILPAGTVNVLALCLGLPRHPRAAARCYDGSAESLAVVDIDVGCCDSRPFLMMVSFGLDARALASLDPKLKRRLGRAAVIGWGLREWWRTPYPVYTCRLGGQAYTGTFVTVSNIPYYAGPFKMVPAASFHDRALDVLVYRGRGRFGTLRFALAMLRGRHLDDDDVVTATASSVVLDGEGPVWAQIDGDPVELTLPVEVTVAEHRLRLLAPATSARRPDPPGLL